VKVSQSFRGMGSAYCLLPAGFLLVHITFFQGQYFEKLKLFVNVRQKFHNQHR
jgi:hypothetical protein